MAENIVKQNLSPQAAGETNREIKKEYTKEIVKEFEKDQINENDLTKESAGEIENDRMKKSANENENDHMKENAKENENDHKKESAKEIENNHTKVYAANGKKIEIEKEEKKEERKSSMFAAFVRDMIARMTADRLIGPKIQNGEIRKNLVEPPWKCPACFHQTQIDLPRCRAQLLSLAQNPNLNRVVLQLHGGGYIGAMRNKYRSFAGLYNEIGGGINVFTPDYRVAPQDPYPAALEDAVDAWNWLLKSGCVPEKIVVAGDSAGGGLALGLCLYLKDHGMALPEGLILMSPWTDLTASGESYETNFTKDPLFGNTKESMIYNRDYVGDEDPRNPYISPLFGSYEGFPPMLIQVGSIEMLLSDSVSLAKKAKEAGVKVRLSIYEGMFHVFQMGELMLQESKKAWEEAGKFLRVLDLRRKQTFTMQEEEDLYGNEAE